MKCHDKVFATSIMSLEDYVVSWKIQGDNPKIRTTEEEVLLEAQYYGKESHQGDASLQNSGKKHFHSIMVGPNF